MTKNEQIKQIAKICDHWSDNKLSGVQAMNRIIGTFKAVKRERMQSRLVQNMVGGEEVR